LSDSRQWGGGSHGHLDLLDTNKHRELITGVAHILEAELDHFLQTRPELIQGRCLRVSAWQTRNSSDIELCLWVLLDEGIECLHAFSILVLNLISRCASGQRECLFPVRLGQGMNTTGCMSAHDQ
jgi:hypothetical protein